MQNLDKMDVADLLSNESFINYCKGSLQEDVAFWKNYIAANPEGQSVVEEAHSRFIELFSALSNADLDEQLALLQNRLSNIDENAPARRVGNERDKSRRTKLLPILLKMSGAAVVLIAVGLFVFPEKRIDKKNVEKKFASACGERKNIQLPDGSVVMLNAASKIVIDKSYGVSYRNVYLEGEAFFDVKHNASVPFIVHTTMMDVKALGTAFDVKAYLNDNITTTSLIRGLVEVTIKEEDNRVMLLHPNQKISWEKRKNTKRANTDSFLVHQIETLNNKGGSTRPFRIGDSSSVKEIAWTENKLVFQGETLEEIANALGRWYGVRIQFKDNAIRNYRFTGVFEKEELNTVLDFLKESRHFTYAVEEGDPTIINLSK